MRGERSSLGFALGLWVIACTPLHDLDSAALGSGGGNGGGSGGTGGASAQGGSLGNGGSSGNGGSARGGSSGNGGSAHGGALSEATGGAAAGGTQTNGGVSALGGARQAGGAGSISGFGGASAASGGSAQGGVVWASGGASQGGVAGSAASGSGGLTSGAGGAINALEPTCAGCARLSTPLAAPSDKANFVITLPTQRSFSAATLSIHLYVAAGSGGQLQLYVQHGGSPNYLQLFQDVPVDIASLSGWQDITWNVGAQQAPYDKTIVGRVGVQLNTSGATSWTNPTVIYVDSFSVTGADTGPWTFDSAATISDAPANSGAANVMFCNYGDGSVSGSAVSFYSH